MVAATAPTPSRRSRRSRRSAQSEQTSAWIGGMIGIIGVLILWQIAAITIFEKSGIVPAPTAIVSQMRQDGWEFYWNNAKVTLMEAIKGYLWGNAIALFLAFLFLLLPVLEGPLMKLGVAAYCLPVIAIGPVLAVIWTDDKPKIILAALSVFFTTLVGALVGLRSTDKTALDMVDAYGGGPLDRLFKVRLRYALPSLFAGLRIAAPAALLGAIIGEYIRAESGLGTAMIASQQALQIERTWGIALVATALAGIGYGITALVGNSLTTWAPKAKV